MHIALQHTGPKFMGKGEPTQAATECDQIYVDRNICGVLGLDPNDLDKVGYGRSVISLAKLKERLFLYENVHLNYDPVLLGEAVSRAREAFKVGPLEHIGVRQVRYKDSSAAGYGYQGKKGDGCNRERALKLCDRLLGHKSHTRTPCMAYARGHFSTREEPKTRLVWGFPFHQTLIEGMYAQPLIDAYLSSPKHPMVFGHTSSYVAAKMNTAVNRGFVQMTDFSGFDSSIQPVLIDCAFDVLFANFPDYNVHHREMIQRYFVCTPIIFADGERYQKNVGVPSGSFFTQLVDSVVSFIVAHYCCLRQGQNPSLVLVLGDDSLVSTPSQVSIKGYKDSALELGIRVSNEKSLFNSTKYVHFLGHTLSDGGVLVRPFQESLERLIFTERYEEHTFMDSIQRCMGHYVDSGHAGALTLAFLLYHRAHERNRSHEVNGMNWDVRGTGYQMALGVAEPIFGFSESLLIDH